MEVLGVADDVVVGDDVALFVEHHARTKALVGGDLYDRGQHPRDHSLVIVLQLRGGARQRRPGGLAGPRWLARRGRSLTAVLGTGSDGEQTDSRCRGSAMRMPNRPPPLKTREFAAPGAWLRCKGSPR
jgi:hypothetical protein